MRVNWVIPGLLHSGLGFFPAMTCLSVSLILINVLFFILGWGVCAYAIYVTIRFWAVMAWMSLTIAIAAGILGIMAILSFFGAGYDEKHPNKKYPLYIYFLFLMILMVALGGVGTICFISWDKVSGIIMANVDYWVAAFQQLFPDTPALTADDVITFITNNLKILGGFSIGTGGLLIVGIILTAIILGRGIWRFTLSVGSIALFLAGGGVIALGIYTYVAALLPTSISAYLSLAIGIVGGVCAVLALWGLLNMCCQSRGCACTWGIVMTLLGAAVIALAIIIFFWQTAVVAEIQDFCTNTTVENAQRCADFYNSTTIDGVISYVTGNFNMVAAGSLWVGGFVLYMVLASFIYCCLKNDAGRRSSTEVQPVGQELRDANRPDSNQSMEPTVEAGKPLYGGL
ncbi:hypothetical protein PAPYR_5524 [Paratrimastix pyriformis]|uniref:Transmembrane protein n=1 Tax=Paratrimastix pyriformis TaxID=342808 RepID=A0ABQ8UHP5_9EUKA|nr:hypothetical protein PAPYR_5524 [Paratrimastix pyriformis]